MGYSLIERPEARYRIVYGQHDKVTLASELPSHFNALFLERNWQYSQIAVGDGFSFKNNIQYPEIVNKAKEIGAKIYFGGVPFKELPFEIRAGRRVLLQNWQDAIFGGEVYIGSLLAISLASEIYQNKNKQISRRDFLRWFGKGAAAAWGLNLTYLGQSGIFFIKENQEVSRTLEKIISAGDPIHPENLILWFQNAVVAKKLIFIGKLIALSKGEYRRKPEIAVVFGAGHTGLAQFLRKGEEACKNVVRVYPRWFLKAMVAEGNLDYLSLIIGAKFNPQDNLWVVSDRFFDEGLYNLVNKEQEYSSARKEVR